MFLSSWLTALGAATSVVNARAVVARAEDATGRIAIYAYGVNVPALPLFYGDGLAYLGWRRPENATVAANVTFSSSGDHWVAQPTNHTVRANWTTPRLYIDRSEGAFAPAGFTSATNTSVTTTGIEFYGTQLIWKGFEGEIESRWFAAATGQEGLWHLKWNAGTALEDNAAPIVLKNLPPDRS